MRKTIYFLSISGIEDETKETRWGKWKLETKKEGWKFLVFETEKMPPVLYPGIDIYIHEKIPPLSVYKPKSIRISGGETMWSSEEEILYVRLQCCSDIDPILNQKLIDHMISKGWMLLDCTPVPPPYIFDLS